MSELAELNLPLLLQVAALYTLLAVSPGANFVIISNTALSHSRQAAVVVGAGVSTASVLFSALALAGWGAVLLAWKPLMVALQGLGALYLIHMGVRLLWLARRSLPIDPVGVGALRLGQWYLLGLGTNLANPKTLIFFLSVFSVLFAGKVSLAQAMACLAVIAAISLTWNAGVALVFSNRALRQRYVRVKPWVDGTAGVCLAYFGIRLLVSTVSALSLGQGAVA